MSVCCESAAWHWLAAGPRWANRAWPTAATAAAAKDAVALHRYEEAAALLKAAIGAADQDPGSAQEGRQGAEPRCRRPRPAHRPSTAD